MALIGRLTQYTVGVSLLLSMFYIWHTRLTGLMFKENKPVIIRSMFYISYTRLTNHSKLTSSVTKPLSTVTREALAPTVPAIPHAFHQAMSTEEHATVMTVLRRFAEAADAVNLTYFMYWGSLLGSYRHHGRIPWDGDVDVMVSGSQKHKLSKMLMSLAPKYGFAKSGYTKWKVFARNSRVLKVVPWRFPFVDVSFYSENQKLLWDQDPGYNRIDIYKKSDIFPLCRRPFAGMMLPAPHNTRVALKQFNLKANKCFSSHYNHSVETFIPSNLWMSLPCSKLWQHYPFVFRNETNNGIMETLKIGSQIISWFMANR